MDLLPLVEEYGIPAALVAGFLWLLYRRVIIFGAEATSQQKSDERRIELLTRELEYRDRLRTEERAARKEAEDRLAALTDAIRAGTAVMEDVQDILEDRLNDATRRRTR